jgi:hypothetical protein
MLITFVVIEVQLFIIIKFLDNDLTDGKNLFGLKQLLLKKTMGVLKKTNFLSISNPHSGQTIRNYFILSTGMLFRISWRTRLMSKKYCTTNIR